MHFFKRLAIIAFLVLPIAASLYAQEKHTATLEQALSLKLINSPRISPDGRFVAYRLRETNWKGNEFLSQLWLVNVSTGKSIQLTRGKKSAGSAEWSPDGHWLAFATERESTAVESPAPPKKRKRLKTKSPRKKRLVVMASRQINRSGSSLPKAEKPGNSPNPKRTLTISTGPKTASSSSSRRIRRKPNPAKTAKKNTANMTSLRRTTARINSGSWT